MTFDFKERLAFSKGMRGRTDTETIKSMIEDCISIELATQRQDRLGIDYIATLNSGQEIYIDAKARDAGCSQFWRSSMPELALEDWSVMPDRDHCGKVGWTLDTSKQTQLVLFTFDPVDTDRCYLISFQLLRIAFKRNKDRWLSEYKSAPQVNNGWISHCVFVPVREVFKMVLQASCGRISRNS